MGTVTAGADGHLGLLYSLAVSTGYRSQGIAAVLIAEIEQRLEARECPQVMPMVRRGNEAVLDLYSGLGYREDDVLVLGKRLISDE